MKFRICMLLLQEGLNILSLKAMDTPCRYNTANILFLITLFFLKIMIQKRKMTSFVTGRNLLAFLSIVE